MHLCENSRKLKSSIRLLVCNCAIMTNKPSILSTLYGIYSYIKPNGCSLNLRTFPYRLIECVCVCVKQVQSKQKTTPRNAKQSNMIMSGQTYKHAQTHTRKRTVGAFVCVAVYVCASLFVWSLALPLPCAAAEKFACLCAPCCVSV